MQFSQRWIIVVVASLAMTATLPGRTHGIGLITKPLLEDLSLSETTFGIINFWSILLGAAFCWPIGRIIDHFGTRGTLATVAASLGVVVIAMGNVASWWALFIALVLTRGLGQGALSVISTSMIGKWFNRRVGMAMGVFAILLAIGFIVSVLAMGEGIKRSGWRWAWQQMGWYLLVGLAPLALLFTGAPDGVRAGAVKDTQNESLADDEQDDFTLLAALATPAFWTFSAASCLFGCAWSAITLYNELILESRGFSRDDFYRVMAIITGVGLVANLGGGWLATRWPLGRLLGIGMLTLAASLVAFPWVRTHAGLWSYAITFGVASGLVTVVHFAFHPQAFGKTHLGQIQGFFQVLSVFTSALGPLILAWCKEWSGSYEGLFLAVAPVSLVLAVAAAWVPMPTQSLRANARCDSLAA